MTGPEKERSPREEYPFSAQGSTIGAADPAEEEEAPVAATVKGLRRRRAEERRRVVEASMVEVGG